MPNHLPISVVTLAAFSAITLLCCPTVNAAVWLSDWLEYGGHQYRMTGPMLWTEAQAQAVSVGGHLASINDAAENEWLLENMLPFSPYTTWGAWMGLYQPPGSPEPDGGWQWINGELLTFLNWDDLEPNDAAGAFNEYVGEIYGPTGGVRPGTWNDLPNEGYTGTPLPGIVEVVPEPMSVCLLALGGLAAALKRRT